MIGILLGGIVAMQVSLLRLNAGISRAVQTQSTLELQNATLQASIAEATSGERLREAAADLSLVEPQAGQTRYLTAHPATDPRRAARRMKPTSERAIAIMANGGEDPRPVAPPPEARQPPPLPPPPTATIAADARPSRQSRRPWSRRPRPCPR